MYHDMPDSRLYQNLQESLYVRHPARIDIGGTVESVRQITRAQLEQCWKTFYSPANMTLVVAGDVDPASILEGVEARVAALGLPAGGAIRRGRPKEPARVAAARRVERMQVGRPKFLMAWKETSPPAAGRDLLVREIEMNLALDSMLGRGSALYGRLYSRGLIDDSFSAHYSTTPTFGATVMGGETDDPEALERELVAGAGRWLSSGPGRRDLDRIRRKYLGSFLRGFDSVEQCAFALLRFGWKQFPVFELPKLVRHVTASGIARTARRHLAAENRVVSLVVPKDGGGAAAG